MIFMMKKLELTSLSLIRFPSIILASLLLLLSAFLLPTLTDIIQRIWSSTLIIPNHSPVNHTQIYAQNKLKALNAVISDSESVIVPLLTSHVGDNNQLIEYMTAAVIARATNRTLCLTPFFTGPAKHGGGWQNNGLAVEERYNVETLSKFVKVSTEESCLEACGKAFDSFWWLRATYPPRIQQWNWNQNVTTHNLSWAFVHWASDKDIGEAFSHYASERCVALGGIFPGLRWRGAYLAASAYFQASNPISDAASAVLTQAMGSTHHHPFLAVHWRFHEANCPKEELGLCFLRCPDGSVIGSGLHPAAGDEWNQKLNMHRCPRGHFHAVGVSIAKQDLIDAILEKARMENVSFVHLATDGWMRGAHGQALVKEVVSRLRQSGLLVAGLWSVEGLPNFPNGSFFNLSSLGAYVRGGTTHSVSQIEQEICSRAWSFLGSGESTWSLTVFRSRMATRRRQQLQESLLHTNNSHRGSPPHHRGLHMEPPPIKEDAHHQQDTLPKMGLFNNKKPIPHHSLYEVPHHSHDQHAHQAHSITPTIALHDHNHIIDSLIVDAHAAGLQCQYQAFFRRAKVNVTMETSAEEAPDGWLDIEACEGRIGKGGKCKIGACF